VPQQQLIDPPAVGPAAGAMLAQPLILGAAASIASNADVLSGASDCLDAAQLSVRLNCEDGAIEKRLLTHECRVHRRNWCDSAWTGMADPVSIQRAGLTRQVSERAMVQAFYLFLGLFGSP